MRQAKPQLVKRLLNTLRGQHAQRLESQAPALIKLLHSNQVQWLHVVHSCSFRNHATCVHGALVSINAHQVTCLGNLLLQEAVTGSAVAGRFPAWAWQTSLLTFAAVGLLQAHADMDEERLSPGRVSQTLLWHLQSSSPAHSLGLWLHPPLQHFVIWFRVPAS